MPQSDLKQIRHTRLGWLVIAGAAMLLLGVLVFCHAELRGARSIDEMNRLLDQFGHRIVDDEPTESRERRDAEWNSFFAERWFGYEILAPVGAGLLFGSLAMLAVTGGLRFSLRTLIVATIYCALLVGIPFGAVRPHLHRTKLELRFDGGFWHSGLRYEQRSRRAAGGSVWSFPLLCGKSLIPVFAGMLAVPLLAFLPTSERSPSRLKPDDDADESQPPT